MWLSSRLNVDSIQSSIHFKQIDVSLAFIHFGLQFGNTFIYRCLFDHFVVFRLISKEERGAAEYVCRWIFETNFIRLICKITDYNSIFGTFEHSEKWYSGITQSVQRFQIIYVFTNAECKISLVANDIYNFRMCKWKQLNVLMTLCTIIICIFVSVIYRHTCTLYTSNRKRTSAFSATVAMSNYVATLIRVLLPCYLAQLFAIQNRIKYSKL